MKNKKGFTLVELLVVIAIIGLLATIAFISLNRARENARNAKRISDIRQVQSVLELYYNDQGGYPAMASNPIALHTALNAALVAGSPSYMAVIPQAPTPADGTGCQAAGNNEYDYSSTTSADVLCTTAAGSCPPAANGAGGYRMGFCISQSTGGLTVAAGGSTCTARPSGITCP